MSDKNNLGEYASFVKPHWTKEELDNFKVVVGFMQTLKEKAFDRLLSQYGDHPYLQHNPGMENGIAGVLKEAQKLATDFPNFFLDTKHVYLDSQFVIIQAHFTVDKAHRGDDSKGLNFIDIWKVTDGKIVEHWDSIQPLDGVALKNSNGIF